MKKTPYIVIYGPTASGKSKAATILAKKIDGEIVACDSVQIYKDFNIGSATPSLQEQKEVKHHMINLLSYEKKYDASDYSKDAKKTIYDIKERKKIPIVVVGTGLYYRALLEEDFHLLPSCEKLRAQLNSLSKEELYQKLSQKDPKRAQQIHPNDKFRLARALEIFTLTNKTFSNLTATEIPKSNPLTIFIHPERKDLHQRIEKRCGEMLMNGWIEEVENLLKKGCKPEAKPIQAIGYKQIIEGIKNNQPFSETKNKIIYATRQYAKRQITWFKKLKPDYEIKNWDEIKNIKL